MEAGEGSGALKRQRTVLSDSEDNAWLPPGRCVYTFTQPVVPVVLRCVCVCVINEGRDGQKRRRRVEPAGRENRSPEASSGRRNELQTRADTPTVPSVRSRVQLLTQRQDGNQHF